MENAKNTPVTSKSSYTPLDEQQSYRYMEKICLIFSFIVLAVFPFVIGPQLYINLTETKFWTFVVLTLCFVAAIAVTVLKCYMTKHIRTTRQMGGIRQFTLPQLFIIAYIIWGVLSAVLSDYDNLFIGQSRYEGVLSMLLYGIIFILLSFWGEFSNRFIYGMACMSILVGFFAFTQIMGSHFMYPDGYSYGNSGFLSTIGNIDCVSGLISIVLPALCVGFILQESKLRFLSLAGIIIFTYVQLAINVDSGKLALTAALLISIPFILNSKRNIVRALIMFASILGTAGIQRSFAVNYDQIMNIYSYEATHSKAAIIMIIMALLCGIAAYIVYKKVGEISISPKKIAIVLGCTIGVIIIAGIVFIFTYTGANPLLVELSAALHGNMADDAGSGRGIVWKRTVQLIGEHPILGSGTGAFLEAFAPYNVGLTQTFDFAHNDFLQIAACQGIVGLILYLGFIISLAVRGFKKIFRCPWVLVCISSCVGYIVYSFFTFSIAIVSPLFWVMAGLLDKMVRQIPETAEGVVWPREEIELITAKKKAIKKASGGKNKKRK